MKKSKTKLNLFIKLLFCLIFVLIIGITKTDKVLAKNETENKKLYLSDISYMSEKTFLSSGHMVKTDKNDSDKLITLKVDNESKVFVKGICAWATSEVVYDLNGYNYDYFTSYIGVDISEQSNYYNTGVKFSVYTSNDAEHWEQKFASNTVFYGWTNAEFIKVKLEGAKYLKLVANNNSPNWWAEWYDEAIFADAKLLKEGYVENDINEKVDFIKTVEEYDEEIKGYIAQNKQGTNEYELALLQREFVKNFDYNILLNFVNCEDKYKETVKWLMTDLDNIRLYILGGEPDGNYISSMQALTSLYMEHKSDLDIKEKTSYGTVKGELYKKMMITLSLTHSAQVSLWMDTASPENQSTAIDRYEIFKKLHEDGKFVVSRNADGTPKQDHTGWFENLKVEEMRYVLNNIIDDEEIVWLNEYTQKRLDEYIKDHPGKEEVYLQPHPYMKYIWPDYSRAEFHDPNKKDYWDKKYDNVFSKYKVTYRNGLIKLWMNIEGGAVCGGISKIGSNIRGVHGTPSSVISQPGHAALIYYRKDEKGNGYWTIDNDVSGWAQSGKTEKLSVRMPLGWGSDEYVDGWAASYIVLAQEALNHYSEYEKATELILLANSYEGDIKQQEKLYREALGIQPYNIDAWYGLIKLYKTDSSKTQDDYYSLAEEMGEKLKYFPLPMYNLTNLLKEKMTDTQHDFKFTILQTRLLTEGSTLDDKCTEVYQPSITRTVAKYLLGEMDKELATFSFDGEDAGKIVLSDRYDNSGIRWDYTLSGKDTDPDKWIKVNYSAEDEHKLSLTKDQIASITADNDIYIHIVGLSYDEENLYKIDITTQTISPNLYANDLENRIVGIDPLVTEWRYTQNKEIATVSIADEENDGWISFEKQSPVLKGNTSIQIRQLASGSKLASDPVTYNFTDEGEDNLKRQYVPVSHLSIEDVSTEEPGHDGAASKAIDGNYNTRYHSNWNGQDTQRYMVIKVDRPIYLSAVEFVPAGGGNGKIEDGTIYGKLNEEDEWVKLSEQKGLTYTGNVNDPDFGKNPANIKKFEVEESQKVQYIKIVADKTNGNWFTARMFNIFQDLEKNPHPTAGVAFSTTDPTTENVEARLVNFSSDNIEITNNNGSDTYLFTDNDTFVFEFIDTKTKKTGTAEARVNWIDRKAPTATIKYSTTNVTDGEVVAELIPSEDVTVTNNPHNEFNENGKLYTFTRNGKFEFQFQDAAGNTGTAEAEVKWIKTKTSTPNGYLPGDPGVEEPGIEDPSTGGSTEPEQQDPNAGGSTKPEQQDPNAGGSTKPEQQDPNAGGTTKPEQQDPNAGGTTKPEQQDPSTGETTKPEQQDPSTGETTKPEQQDPSTGETTKPEQQVPNVGEVIKLEESKKSTTNNSTQSNSKTGTTLNNTMSKKMLPQTGEKNVKIVLTIGILITMTAVVILYTRFTKVGKGKHC